MKVFKIKDFADVITGGTPSTKNKSFWDNGTIPWLNSAELNKGIIRQAGNFITKEGLERSAAKLMPPSTVLIALTGATTGKTAILNIEACANQSVTGILPSPNHDTKYLYYYLTSIREKVISDSYGGAQKHISQGYVKEISIPLPPLPVQKRIAEILDEADALRKKDAALIQKYDELLQSIFYDMFGDPVKNEKGWEEVTIADVTEIIRDGPHVSPKYSLEGYPILSTRNIRPNRLIMEDVKYVSKEVYERLTARFKPTYNDVLLTKGGTTGYAKVVDFTWDFCVWVHLAVLRPNKKINPKYLEGVLNTDFCYNQSQKYTHGITNKDLGLKRIAKIKIPLPPKFLQEQYENTILNIEAQKQTILAQQQQSEALFQSLMQRAFKGELVGQ